VSRTATGGQSRERVRVTRQRGLRFPLGGLAEEEGRELQRVAILAALRPLQVEEVRQALAAYSRVGDGLLCLCPALDAGGAELVRDALRKRRSGHPLRRPAGALGGTVLRTRRRQPGPVSSALARKDRLRSLRCGLVKRAPSGWKQVCS